MSSLLDRVNTLDDLRDLSIDEMNRLAAEMRSLIIGTVSKTGGHLAANLGTVELTIAMLKIFSPPTDKIVWDVGHQAYSYKILTGRKERFNTLRQADGISGFTRREESECDPFGAGHCGTALSAALGIAAARDRNEGLEHVIAVVGDGSMGNGISLEALNNLASTTERLIVVLNDNEMSIAANVGSFARHLGQLLANPRYNRWKSSVEDAARRMRLGWARRTYHRMEEFIKGWFLRNVMFEEFGLRYIGPVEGHNLHALIDAFQVARDYGKPILIHVSTRKGKGYPFAEEDPEQWHGTSSFDVATGKVLKSSTALTYSGVFGKTLERLAKDDSRVTAVTAAMSAGTGLRRFSEHFEKRFFDVGICEEHGAVFSAGMATEGFRPFFAVYSTFSQRAVDCVIHDICLQNLPVVLCLDRAGIVGDDGPTHHGVFDIALFRPVPNLVFMQPGDETELANMMYSALKWDRPVMIRYPRGTGPGTELPEAFEEIELSKALIVREPDHSVHSKLPNSELIWFWALGDMVPVAERAAEFLEEQGVAAGVVNARFIRPMDKILIDEHSRDATVIVTLENGVVSGGFGSGVQDILSEVGYTGRVVKFGWPDEFIPHGGKDALMEQYGLTPEAVAAKVASLIPSA